MCGCVLRLTERLRKFMHSNPLSMAQALKPGKRPRLLTFLWVRTPRYATPRVQGGVRAQISMAPLCVCMLVCLRVCARGPAPHWRMRA
jgi:hypothetical protein